MDCMRPSLLLYSLLLCLGCARSVEPVSRPDDAATVEGGDTTAATSALNSADAASPESGGTAEAPPTPRRDAERQDAGLPPRPTASRERPEQPPAAPAAECRSDDECTITQVPEGECCPRLCSGRPVTAKEAQAIDARVSACEARGGPCAIPPCAPPRTVPVAVCTGGRCGVQMVPRERP